MRRLLSDLWLFTVLVFLYRASRWPNAPEEYYRNGFVTGCRPCQYEFKWLIFSLNKGWLFCRRFTRLDRRTRIRHHKEMSSGSYFLYIFCLLPFSWLSRASESISKCSTCVCPLVWQCDRELKSWKRPPREPYWACSGPRSCYRCGGPCDTNWYAKPLSYHQVIPVNLNTHLKPCPNQIQ